MTTHEMAKQLLALPDVPLIIEGWVEMYDFETVARMTRFDPEGTAIIMQHRPNPLKDDPQFTYKFVSDHMTDKP